MTYKSGKSGYPKYIISVECRADDALLWEAAVVLGAKGALAGMVTTVRNVRSGACLSDSKDRAFRNCDDKSTWFTVDTIDHAAQDAVAARFQFRNVATKRCLT